MHCADFYAIYDVRSVTTLNEEEWWCGRGPFSINVSLILIQCNVK
jgi:hypothetical protein